MTCRGICIYAYKDMIAPFHAHYSDGNIACSTCGIRLRNLNHKDGDKCCCCKYKFRVAGIISKYNSKRKERQI